MGKQQVMLFFAALALLAGILFFLQSGNFGNIEGMSIAESALDEHAQLALQEVTAYREGKFIHIDALIRSSAPQHSSVQLAYLIEHAGMTLKQGEARLFAEYNQLIPYRLVLSLPPDAPLELSLTLSVTDGNSVAYRNVPVLSHRSILTGNATATQKNLSASLGLILVFCFVCGYGLWFALQHARMKELVSTTGIYFSHASRLR